MSLVSGEQKGFIAFNRYKRSTDTTSINHFPLKPWPNMSLELLRFESKSFSRILFFHICFFCIEFSRSQWKKKQKKLFQDKKTKTYNISAVCSPFWTCHAGSRSIDWLLIYQFRTSTLGFIALMKSAWNGEKRIHKLAVCW